MDRFKTIIIWIVPFLVICSALVELFGSNEELGFIIFFSGEKGADLMLSLCLLSWIDRKANLKAFVAACFCSFVFFIELIEEMFLIKAKGLKFGELGAYIFAFTCVVLIIIYIFEKWIQRQVK